MAMGFNSAFKGLSISDRCWKHEQTIELKQEETANNQ